MNEKIHAAFAEHHPDIVAAAEAAGIDWKGLLDLLGPIVLALLQKLLNLPKKPAA